MNIAVWRMRAASWKTRLWLEAWRTKIVAAFLGIPQSIADWFANESSLPLIPYCREDGTWVDVRITAETQDAYHVTVPETGPRTWKQLWIRGGENATILKNQLVVGQRPHTRRRTYENKVYPTAA